MWTKMAQADPTQNLEENIYKIIGKKTRQQHKMRITRI